MTKSEFIKKFGLRKIETQAYFRDGKVEQHRALYADLHGKLFVFYNGDLHCFTPYGRYEYVESAIDGRIGFGYSMYH